MRFNLILVLLPLFAGTQAYATLFQAAANGNWSEGTTWGGACASGCIEGLDYPGAGDSVKIGLGRSVTVDVPNGSCLYLFIGISTGAGTLAFNAFTQLTIGGIVYFGSPGNSGTLDMTAGGNLICSSFSVTNGSFLPGGGSVEFTNTFTLPNNAGFDEFNNLNINGGTVTNSRTLTINGDFNLSSGSFVSNNKKVLLGGNWNQDGASFVEGSGSNDKVVLNGSSMQTISGEEIFNHLEINNASGVRLLPGGSGEIQVSGNLTFTAGKIILDDANLKVTGSISGAGSSSYVVTNGAGVLKRSAGNAAFPVGFSTTNYTPVTINNSSGTSDIFSVSSCEDVFTDGTCMGTPLGGGANSMVNVTWFITENVAGGSNASLTLQWTAGDEQPTFNNLNCGISRYAGAWDTPPAYGDASGCFCITRTGVTSFSPFMVADNNAVLPVDLLFFSARVYKNNTIQLLWETAMEIANDFFTIQRSKDGMAFESIASVPGNGTSSQPHKYAEFDFKPFLGTSYYRLMQTDFDKSFKLSFPVAVSIDPEPACKIQVYPNPCPGKCYITLKGCDESTDVVTLRVFDILGNMVYEDIPKESAQGFFINFDNLLASGTYFLNASSPEGDLKEKILLEN